MGSICIGKLKRAERDLGPGEQREQRLCFGCLDFKYTHRVVAKCQNLKSFRAEESSGMERVFSRALYV